MPLLKIRGNGFRLSIRPEHPIRLKEGFRYQLALVSFLSENFIHNVLEPMHMYFWDNDIHFIPKPLIIPSGYWTIDLLKEKINDYITSLNLNLSNKKFEIERKNDRIVITSPIKFYLDSKFALFLGYDHSQNNPINVIESYYNANESIASPNLPNIRAVDAIEVHCNIVEHSYVNHDLHSHKHAETELLYTFFLKTAHGYKIYETPSQRLYVNLKKELQSISQIDITLRDQNNRLLQNEAIDCVVVLDLTKT